MYVLAKVINTTENKYFILGLFGLQRITCFDVNLVCWKLKSTCCRSWERDNRCFNIRNWQCLRWNRSRLVRRKFKY